MKKFFTILALAMVSVMGWAVVSITVSPNNVDFGTVSIKGKTHVEDSVTINVTYSGLQQYCGVVFEDDQMPEEGAAFWISGTNSDEWIYGGDAYTPAEGQGLQLHYYANKAGTYTGRIRFYSYSDADWEVKTPYVYLNISLEVSGDAVLPTTSTYERLNSTGDLQSGDTVVFISESAGAVCGPLNGAYLTAVTEGLTLNSAEGTAEVPEGVQTFVLNKYSGNWQFLYPDDNDKALLLDYSSNSGKGAFSTTLGDQHQQRCGIRHSSE